MLLFGGTPFSPGPLTAESPAGETLGGYDNHAQFEGECGLCHEAWQGADPAKCQACHENVRFQLQTTSGLHGLLLDGRLCSHCHTDHEGRGASITQLKLDDFDHLRLTGFSLDKHELDYDKSAIACRDCHSQGRYEAALVECASCHSAAEPTTMIEHIAFMGRDCIACHDGVDTMTAFDHVSVFPLEGAHEPLECRECHSGPVIEGTPGECAGCHAEPEIHLGLFGTDCVRCHSTAAWTPAQLTGHTFPLDHGGEGKIDCQVCHLETYVNYTCTNCHAHDEAEVREEHIDEGIFDFADCVECHPTGREDEMEDE